MIRCLAAAALFLMLAVAGCGVGRYDADYAEATERHRRGEPFLAPRPPAAPGVAGEGPPIGEGQPAGESGAAAP